MIYLYCVTAMCEISLKNPAEAEKPYSLPGNWQRRMSLSSHLSNSTDFFRDFWSPASAKKILRCTENIGCSYYLQPWMDGGSQSCIRQTGDRRSDYHGISIAMLACRDWSNREIAEHIGVSLNTVKHYLTDIFNKLHVKREMN